MRPAACATEQHFVFYLVRTGVRVVAAAKAERIPHLQDVQRQKGVASAALGLCLSASAILCGVSFLVSLGSGLWSVFFSLFWFCGVFCACSRVCCVLCGCVSCVSVCSFLHLTVVVPFWPPSLPESPRVLHAVRVPSSLLSPQWLSIENLDPPPNTAITQNGSQAPQQRT